jgi:HKD family nuclease
MSPTNHIWGPQNRSVGRMLRRMMRQSARIWLLSPYLTHDGVQEFSNLIHDGKDVRLITRLNDRDILSGVLDPDAIAEIQDAGVKVRFHNDSLHAKLWIFDNLAIVGSANLTGHALSDNVELMVTQEGSSASILADDFSNLWQRLRNSNKSSDELREIATRLLNHPAQRRFKQVAARNGLVDYGGSSRSNISLTFSGSGFWLKINGLSSDRIDVNTDLRSEYAFEGGQTFPGPKQRPRGLKEGDLLILTRIGDKNDRPDRCIYGRGIVDVAHRPEIDEAPGWLRRSIGKRKYEEFQIDRWPRIVWLRDMQLVDGLAGDCPWLSDVNLEQLIVGQKSHLEVTKEQAATLNEALDRTFNTVGCVHFERPEGVWWNSGINDPSQYVTRTRLEIGTR